MLRRIFSSLIGLALVASLFVPGALAESQQTSGRTAQNIIDFARWEYLDDTDATDGFWKNDSNLLNILNRGIVYIAAITKCLETTEKITLQAGVTEYAISSNYIGVENAIYSGTTTSYNSSIYKGLERVDIRKLAHSENVGEPVKYYVWNDKVGIDPEPASGVSGYAVYLYLIERPSIIALSGAIPTPAIYDHALTLFVAAHALKKDRQMERSKMLTEEYLMEIGRFREDLIDKLRTPLKGGQQ